MFNYNLSNDDIHLYMPHAPFYYPEYFEFKDKNSTNYKSYWKFTNTLILDIITKIAHSGKVKIIVTGDHGFRRDNNLNKNKTFLALYSFDSLKIEEIKCVQDLGSLINSNF